ncbi:TIGR03086 family metal-binding protein [Spirillospora sp. NPDC047279]|uniref:TIGR03086 family metal-binding protein n=1 Tax=Spirillospora sp. NPDC047279 TaxID=3155478 RepID=UPI0033F3F870
MNAAEVAALQKYGAGLLGAAIGHALEVVEDVTQDLLARPTPCRGWNLRMLFLHVNDSLDALYEGFDSGEVTLLPEAPPFDPGTDLVAAFRDRARRLGEVWSGAGDGLVTVAGCPMRAGMVAGTGAMEVAVHGWDISRACGDDRPIPAGLAHSLLRLSPMLVADDVRHGLFAPPVEVPPDASPGDRLVGRLGRDPRWRAADDPVSR